MDINEKTLTSLDKKTLREKLIHEINEHHRTEQLLQKSTIELAKCKKQIDFCLKFDQYLKKGDVSAGGIPDYLSKGMEEVFSPEDSHEVRLIWNKNLSEFIKSRLRDDDLEIPIEDGSDHFGKLIISPAVDNRFSHREKPFYFLIAALIGWNLRYDKLKKRLETEIALNRMIAYLSKVLISTFSLDQIAEVVFMTALEITRSPYGLVGYVDPETGQLICPAFSGEVWKGKRGKKKLVIRDFSGLWGWVVENKIPLISNNLQDDPRYTGIPSEHIPIKRFLCVPAVVEDRVLGIIAQANSDFDYSEKDLEILELMADLLGEAIGKTRIENQLRESEKKYRSLFERSMDGIYMTTPEGELIDMNPAGIRMLGYSSVKDLKSLGNVIKLYDDPSVREKFKKDIAENGYVKDFEIVLKRKDGGKIHTLNTSFLVKDQKGKITAYYGFLKDITERVKQENALRRMNRELKKSYEILKKTQAQLIQQEKLASIGELAAGIAHEINNPLGFLTGNYQTLIKYFLKIQDFMLDIFKLTGDAPDKWEEKHSLVFDSKRIKKLKYILEDVQAIFDESEEGFQRILSIVQNLKSFSRVDVVKNASQYDLNSAIESTLIVARNEIKYVAEVTKDFKPLPQILCVGSEINQVLLNIIVNAAQAIGSQKREEKGKIHIKTWFDSENVYCSIQDDGPGIPEELIHKIFDPFFTTKEPGKGTGLGLYIAYDIVVNKHKGKLNVESTPGKGTTFIIKLPIESPVYNSEENE